MFVQLTRWITRTLVVSPGPARVVVAIFVVVSLTTWPAWSYPFGPRTEVVCQSFCTFVAVFPDTLLLVFAAGCLGLLTILFALISKRREADLELSNQELARARKELERRVEERTAELAAANEALRAEIAERDRLEAELQGEERYRELFENANDLVYVHDLSGKFLAVNKASLRITGYTKEEVLKLTLSQLVAPECVELAQGMIARHLAGEPASTYEVSAAAKSGARLELELSTHLVFRNGTPVAVEGIARDVTERKRLEEQLRHSQKMEAIGRLAGGLAHDLNNLLTVVGAYSQMICDETATSPMLKGYAEEILAATERAGALTTRLLAFSRRQMLQPQVLNLNQLTMSMDNMLRRLIGEDIQLRTVFESRIDPIKADPGQIEQVIMNLTVNARDAMPRGGRLTLATANAEVTQLVPGGPAPGTYVKLAVSDTGVGMSPEVVSHIFEPFFTTKGPGKGTGLGLSTVYGIVKQSGGEITVTSAPGEGTTFTIYFPRSDEAAPTGAAATAVGALAAAPRDRITILLVEDEPGVRRLIRRMLVERGYRVLEASNGPDALELYEHQGSRVDLVLTDIVMPNMSGSELAGKLFARRPGVKILFMTGYSEDAVFEHGVAAGAVPILSKPFLAEALDRKIRELLEGRTNTRELPT